MRPILAGIVTFISGVNYGCVLQRYALQTTLQSFGADVECMNFDPFDGSNKESADNRVNLIPSFNQARRLLVRKIRRILHYVFERKLRIEKANIFSEFEKRFLKNTKRLDVYDDVEKEGERFDVLVAGSDQIWNAKWYHSEMFFKFYMLDFVPSQKRISYAASMGVSKIPEIYAPKFQQYLTDFSWRSVRENEGAKELERILNRSVDVVLDPTMLLSLEEWNFLADQYYASKLQKSPYILCYSLGNQENVVKKALQIRKYHKLPILCLCKNVQEKLSLKIRSPYVKPIMKAGPGEFVSLFKNSAYVVTDSFHGSVFSILYHKPFFTMMRDKKDPTKSMNSRMSTLFSTFHLESRLFSPEDKSTLTPESFEIDYEAVDKILQERREFSVNKLRKAIENVVKQEADA